MLVDTSTALKTSRSQSPAESSSSSSVSRKSSVDTYGKSSPSPSSRVKRSVKSKIFLINRELFNHFIEAEYPNILTQVMTFKNASFIGSLLN